jgi:hypothetical protein
MRVCLCVCLFVSVCVCTRARARDCVCVRAGLCEQGGGGLSLRLESGDPGETDMAVATSLLIAAGADPYKLLERAFAAVADRTGTFRVRANPPPTPHTHTHTHTHMHAHTHARTHTHMPARTHKTGTSLPPCFAAPLQALPGDPFTLLPPPASSATSRLMGGVVVGCGDSRVGGTV